MFSKIYAPIAVVIIGISLFVYILLFNFQEAERVSNMLPYSIPENCDFNQIIERGFGRAGSGFPDKNSCTPDINNLEFVGIVINAPKEVRFSSTETDNDQNAIPLSGIHSHDLSTYIDRNGSLTQSLIIIVKDVKSNVTWSGRIPPKQNLRPQPVPLHGELKKFTREEMKGRINREVFNPNLFNITGMVLRETEYIVYATVGPYKSNMVTIKAIKVEE